MGTAASERDLANPAGALHPCRRIATKQRSHTVSVTSPKHLTMAQTRAFRKHAHTAPQRFAAINN